MKKTNRPNLFFPISIGLLAFILRVWNNISIGDDFYANFLSDASTYKVWASKLAAGGSYGDPIFQMGPLYPYFLSFCLKIGFSFFSVLFLQAAFGALTAVLIYLTAKSSFGEKAGLISGIITALYTPFIFYDGLLLSESLQIFLVSVALYLLLSKMARRHNIKLLVAGLLIGWVALGRATILFFPLMLAAYWLYEYWKRRNSTLNEIILRAATLFAGIIIGIMPATISNLAHGDTVLISSNTGINFYIGNNAKSNGTYEEPPGLNLGGDFTGRQVAEKAAGRGLKSSEVSSFWNDKAWSEIKSNPGHFIGGLFAKTWLYLWYFDISQAESIQIQKLFSPLFNIPLAGFGLVLILGAIGIANAKGEYRWILILLFLANLIGVVLFFVVGRFKLIGTLPLLIGSGAGALVIAETLKTRNKRQLIIYGTSIAILMAILFLPRPISKTEKLASAYDNLGIYYHYKKQPDEAIKWYRMAQAVAPNYSASLNNIGTYFYSRGDLDSAKVYFHKSLVVETDEDKTLMNLGRIALDLGNLDTAKYYYEKAKAAAPFGTGAQEALDMIARQKSGVAPQTDPNSFETLLSLAERLANQGKFDQAEKFYLDARKIKPDDIRLLNNLGFAYQADKKYDAAARSFNRVIELSPDNGIAYNNLAGTIYQMGLLDSAITIWEKALKLDPGNQQFRTNLEYAKKKRGQ
jgi:tetratricopeptide (TPR) repeat protein